VRHYPRKKLVMTSPVKVPGFGKIGSKEIRKEDLIDTWTRIAKEADLPIRPNRMVKAVKRAGNGFVVETNAEAYKARRVVLAIGRRGIPRRLEVPGEEGANVLYALAEPEAYQGDQILVVGGGDSAVEAAVALAEQPNNTVRMSYRGDRFGRIKPGNRERIGHALDRGLLEVHWETNVSRIEGDKVWLKGKSREFSLPNDQVFIFAGGELPTGFLKECGVKVDTKFGAP
jgi:thioredoxin reductase (NADPH)